jgi:hypothetical protein
MEHRILFRPASDKTDPDPHKDYGVHDLELFFQVEGDKGIVEFQLGTNWYQNHIMERRCEHLKKDIWKGEPNHLVRHFIEPFPADLCYYSLETIDGDDFYWETGTSLAFNNAPCYYGYKYFEDDDHDVVAKDHLYQILLEQGDEAMWKYLEEYYHEVFG